MPRSKLREDDHNTLQLGLGPTVSDLSPSTADKLKSDFGARVPASKFGGFNAVVRERQRWGVNTAPSDHALDYLRRVLRRFFVE